MEGGQQGKRQVSPNQARHKLRHFNTAPQHMSATTTTVSPQVPHHYCYRYCHHYCLSATATAIAPLLLPPLLPHC